MHYTGNDMLQTNTYQKYEAFKEKQDTLINLIERLSSVISSLNMSNEEKSLKYLQNVVNSDRFKILVLGEFKRGKSTFINALLGEKILPAYSRRCTAIINEVKWGESKRALLYPLKNGDENTFNLEPREIKVDEIEDYVVIKNTSDTPDNSYDKVELFWPLELCRNGVEIIDSPGLNEHDIRQQITINYLSTVDAVLFVLSCEQLASKSEIDVIDNLFASGHQEMFFICNYFNRIPDEEKKIIKSSAISQLKNKTKPGEKQIFFINALDALEGRIEKDDMRVTNSGIVEVESELENFLAYDKGRIKILRPAREVQRVIQEARKIIPLRESMFKTDLKTLEKRYEDAQKPLKLLQAKRKIIANDISKFINELQQKIAHEGNIFYNDISNKVDDWNKSFNPKTLVNFSLAGNKPKIERLIKEVTDHFEKEVNTEFLVWQSKVLEPLISDSIKDFLQDLDNSTKEFLKQVDTLRLEIAGKPISLVDEIQTKKVSAIERVLAAAGGLLIGGNIGLAGMGAVFGYKEMAKAIIPQLLLSVTALLVLSNAWVIFPVMAIGGGIQSFFTMKSTNKEIQEEIAKRYASQIRDTAEYQGKCIAEAVIKKLNENLNSIDKGLGQEIKNIGEQVNSILHEKQKGQKNVDEKTHELQSLLRSLNDIDKELGDFMFPLPDNH
jgi:ribosome biogenesis GTPase A